MLDFSFFRETFFMQLSFNYASELFMLYKFSSFAAFYRTTQRFGQDVNCTADNFSNLTLKVRSEGSRRSYKFIKWKLQCKYLAPIHKEFKCVASSCRSDIENWFFSFSFRHKIGCQTADHFYFPTRFFVSVSSLRRKLFFIDIPIGFDRVIGRSNQWQFVMNFNANSFALPSSRALT